MTKFFPTASAFRKWLERYHEKASELTVGFYKKGSGPGGITYPEALDEALCFGWIDGVRRSLNEHSYTIRFSPRKPRSIWSRINSKRAAELRKLRRMKPAGLKAFEALEPARSGVYSFENAPRQLDPAYEKTFRARKRAWDFFQAQPPGYRRTVSFWVMSAKKEETRRNRLAQLITDSEKGQRSAEIAGKEKQVK